MSIRIKNWKQFQHFKDRSPPWVKLYRDLLNDMDWHELSPVPAKALVSLWLIASESDGMLPDIKKLAFRLRITEKSMESIVYELSHWLEHDDISTISGRYQGDAPEERRVETETDGFALFWSTYPKKTAKPAALKAFKAQKINGELPDILRDIESRVSGDDWRKEGGKYVPNPATYLNQRRWEDGEKPSNNQFAGAV